MQIQKNNSWYALIGLCLVSFLGCIDFTIVNTALPAIQTHLNVSVTQLQWVINIFMIALSASMVILGKIADSYGRRLILYVGMILFAVASIGAGLSPTIHWLIVFRLLQGISVAILYTVPIAIISAIFPVQHRGKATGILIGINGLGLAIGPVIGGFIVSALNWKWIFFVNPPIVLLAFLFCINTVTESKNTEHENKIDWLGFILLMIGLPSFIFATVQSSTWGLSSSLIITLYVLAIVSFILFYLVENKIKYPMIDFKLFSNRVFITAVIANFSLAFIYTVAFFLMPFYLHAIRFESAYQIGLALLPATAMIVVCSPVVGFLVDKIGAKKTLLIGFFLFFVSILMQYYFSAYTSIYFILLSFILFGMGWACILSPAIVAALSSLPENMSGVAMGAVGTLHNFGGAVGLALGTVIYHFSAKLILLKDAMKNHLPLGDWTNRAIADPDGAVQLLRRYSHVKLEDANLFFEHFFLTGYHNAMLLLLCISLFAFFCVLFGLKK